MELPGPPKTEPPKAEPPKDPARKAPPPPVKRRGEGAIVEAAPSSTSSSSSMPQSVTSSASAPSVVATATTSPPPQVVASPPAALTSPTPKLPRPKPAVVDPVFYKFGAKLVDVYNNTGLDVPLAVEACVSVLQQIGLREEGLFRVPGSSNEVDEIKSSLEQGINPFAAGGRRPNAEAVATCLKLYLRELADPVVPRELYSEFVRIGRISDLNARFAALQVAVHKQLPEAHRELLKVLLPFLRLVSQHSAANKMTTSNLALVFGPTLIPAPRDDMAAMLRDSTAVNNIMVYLIESCDRLFPELFAARQAVQEAASEPAAPAEAAPAPAAVPPTPSRAAPPESDDDDDDDSDPRPNYVTVSAEPEPESDEDEVEIGRLRAKHNYVPRSDTEVGFKVGDVLIVYENLGKDWSRGCNSADPTRVGFIANAYVEQYTEPRASAPMHHAGRDSAPSFAPPPPPPESLEEESTT
eukprot:m.246333 g.246333  ORF g.246333 m.246333 type:complete len:468 (-) comp15012_c0_seq1:127-1530(-)